MPYEILYFSADENYSRGMVMLQTAEGFTRALWAYDERNQKFYIGEPIPVSRLDAVPLLIAMARQPEFRAL